MLLGSRGGEEWLAQGTFAGNVYDLPGLDEEAASGTVLPLREGRKWHESQHAGAPASSDQSSIVGSKSIRSVVPATTSSSSTRRTGRSSPSALPPAPAW